MAETEASTAHAVDEDGKTSESKSTETQQTAGKIADQSDAVSTEVANSKDTVKEAVVTDGAEAAATEESGEAGEVGATLTDTCEGTSAAEPKTSLLDSFLHKSGLGKVMGGRKKKEQGAAVGAEENTADGGDKDGEKNSEEVEGVPEGQAAEEKEPDSVEKEDDKQDKNKSTEAKSTVRDLIRKPVARIFSHRSTEKKDSTTGEPQKQVKVRSKSLDRIEDPEALNTTADPSTEESGAAGGAEEGEHKASSSAQAKHMKRWHSFKKMMAQKTHKKSSGGGEDGKEEGLDGDGVGGDSSTLDSKESGQKRWKLKRSWTFQGMKRDPSVVGISGKAKSSDKDLTDTLKAEEGAGEAVGEEAKAEGAAEGPSAEGGDEEKTPAAGVGAVTQHANEIWTSFKKRVIPKSKRTNTECVPTEEDAAGEEGSSEEGKDGKSAKAKRSHFGRAVSLKNFILRKGKSTSVDMGEGAKEEEGAADGEGARAESAADGEAAPTTEGNSTQPADNEATAKSQGDEEKTMEKTPEETPVTNCENGCSNGTEDNGAHNHQEDDNTSGSSPIKKSKVDGGTKDEANTKIINTTTPGNSGELELVHLETEQLQSSSKSDGDTNSRDQPAQPNSDSSNHTNNLYQGTGARPALVRGQGVVEHVEEGEDITKGHIREAAAAIVQNVMSAAADQLERELCI